MKNLMLKFTLFLTILTVFASCDKLAELIQANFNVDLNKIPFSVNPINTDNSSYSVTGSQYMNADSLIKSKESRLSINNIKECKINSIEVKVTNYDANDQIHSLKNLKSLKCELSTDGTNFEVVKEILAANITDGGVVTVDFGTSGYDVLAKVKTPVTITYRFTASNDKATTKKIDCEAKVNYMIRAGL
ncbi:MAG: hypothetical protein MUE53_06875 [Chitinophagales bacterium]|jgi:hypothetical protein|nr:hypothetical protein [Chitinophagales bacterium]